MIIDVTGVELIPGNRGKDCPGDGSYIDEQGEPIECCCDECDYMKCCTKEHTPELCFTCNDLYCPHVKTKRTH